MRPNSKAKDPKNSPHKTSEPTIIVQKVPAPLQQPSGDARGQLVYVHVAGAMFSQDIFRSSFVVSVTRAHPEQQAALGEMMLDRACVSPT